MPSGRDLPVELSVDWWGRPVRGRGPGPSRYQSGGVGVSRLSPWPVTCSVFAASEILRGA